MAIILNPDEHVFYPQPYLPDEPAELVITNKRMVRVTEMGMAEFNVSEIDYVGRVSKRPMGGFGTFLLLGGLTLFVIGTIAAISNKGPLNSLFGKKDDKLPDLPPLGELGKPPDPKALAAGATAKAKKAAAGAGDAADGDDADDDDDDDGILGQVGGLIMLGGGLLLFIGAIFLIRIKKHQVVCRMGPRVNEIDCKDKAEQTMILSTLGSAVSSSKTMAQASQKAAAMMAKLNPSAAPSAAAAAAKETAEVDDGVDPVRALQELKVQKDSGKIDAATFESKRAGLLRKLAARK